MTEFKFVAVFICVSNVLSLPNRGLRASSLLFGVAGPILLCVDCICIRGKNYQCNQIIQVPKYY